MSHFIANGNNSIKTSNDSIFNLNVNDLAVSGDDKNSRISPNGENPFLQEQSNEQSSIEFQQQPSHSVIVERKILLTKDFYSVVKNDSKFKSPTKPSKWNVFNNSVKGCLPCYKLSKSSTEKAKTFSFISVFFKIFPIFKWLANYSIRENLMYDVIAGVTILALHIPQGLAYGRLAGAEPINGLYVSLFPVIVYAVFGGSRQISIGTFAVISIACRDVVEQIIQSDIVDGDQDMQNKTIPINLESFENFFYQTAERSTKESKITSIEVLTSLCLLVGIIQFAIGLLRLGILATLLSDPIISAFCVGAAVHVFTSQVFSLIGVDSTVGKNEPLFPFEIIRSWYRLGSRITTANLATICISFSTISVLILCKNYLEPFLMKRFKLKSVAIPIDIISIVVLALLSYFCDFNGLHQVQLIPKITAGFEGLPVVPRIDLWPRLLTSAFLLAFICYAGTYSLQKLYARKNKYEVYPNNELFALGLANIVSSFFLCFPCAGSLARSAVQDKVGGKTQLASLISSGLIVVFIMFLSKFLESLPKCVLACIIIVALISTFRKFNEVFHYWKISKLDGVVWGSTFCLVVLLGVDRGLLFGLGVGLGMMIIRLAIPELNLKYQVPNTECYVSNYSATLNFTQTTSIQQHGILIFEFHGPLIFINVERFKKKFQKIVLAKIKKQINEKQTILQNFKISSCNGNQSKLLSFINITKNEQHNLTNDLFNPLDQQIHTVVFDMNQVSYLDSKGVESLLEIESELKQLSLTSKPIQLFLSNVSFPVFDTLTLCQFFSKFDNKNVFLTVHDAVLVANNL